MATKLGFPMSLSRKGLDWLSFLVGSNEVPAVALVSAEDGSPGAQIGAGESYIGHVGGMQGRSSATPVVSASPAYSAGDAIGALMTFSSLSRVNDGTGLIQQVNLHCKSLQSASVDLILFNANPTASTITDNAAFDLAAADYDKVTGIVHITDWSAAGATRSFAQANNLAMPYQPVSGGTSLYGALVARAAMTLASTSDVKVTLKAIQD